jgi:hypothetical protein
MSLKLDISKVHKNAVLEYIYNKLDEKQLYSPFIDLELEKRIKYLCEDVYKAGYKDGQETEKLENRKNEINNDYSFSIKFSKNIDNKIAQQIIKNLP